MYGLTLAGAIHTAGNFGHRRRADPVLARQARPNPSRARLCLRLCHADSGRRGAAGFSVHGKFNILHIGAMTNLVCIVAAMIPVLRSPRPSNWKNQHYYWMSWSYVGLLAAAATELVVRTSHLATREQAWTATSCDVGACHRDWLCPHQPISTGFGFATGSGRCNNPA
jgi:hypothetical protein